jgi:trehalose-6-phosphatase
MATAAAATGARKAAAPVLLLDFDHSLIDANSDPWIVSQLRPELSEVMRALRKQPEYQVWTLLMVSSRACARARRHKSSSP